MQHTRFNEFLGIQQNYSLPLASDAVAVTPGGTNTMGSWVDVFGGTLTSDAYGIYLRPHEGESARPLLMDIGVDYAGGTNYSVLIPQLAFSGPPAIASADNSEWIGTGPFYFPLFIPAGSRVGARAQTSSLTLTAFNLLSHVLQKPTHPELVRCGSKVQALGVQAASSDGTIYTPGTSGAVGAWTSLGTTLFDGFYLSPAWCIANSSVSNNSAIIEFAVGDAVNKRLIVQSLRCGHAATGGAARWPYPTPALYQTLPAGSTIYVRGSDGGSPTPNQTAAVYIVGGS